MTDNDNETTGESDDKGLPPISGDLVALRREIKDAVGKIEALVDDRASLNADKASIVEGMEAKGINRHSLKMAMKYAAMDEKQRQNFDATYQLVREALGAPIQPDLFDEPTAVAAE